MLQLWKYLVCYSLLALTISLNAQEPEPIINDDCKEDVFEIHKCLPSESDKFQPENDTIIYKAPDQRPEFPGGVTELLDFLRKNLKIPIIGTSDMVYKGKTIVEFVVEKDGSISNPVILRSIDLHTDKEALRLIGLMPKWTPAQHDGKPVRAKFIVPIIFRSRQEFDNEPLVNYAEQMPEFPGGKEGLSEYFKENIKLPFSVTDMEYEGRVVVQFIIEKDGTVTHPIIIRSVEPQMDEEALRVIRAMPRWKPGLQLGAPIRVKYTLPVSFR